MSSAEISNMQNAETGTKSATWNVYHTINVSEKWIYPFSEVEHYIDDFLNIKLTVFQGLFQPLWVGQKACVSILPIMWLGIHEKLRGGDVVTG